MAQNYAWNYHKCIFWETLILKVESHVVAN